MSNYPAGSVVHVPKFSPELARAVGWRPPAQVVETLDGLHALPVGTLIVEIEAVVDEWDPVPNVWLREADEDGPFWSEPGWVGRRDSSLVSLPVLVVWSPPEKARPTE